MSDQQQCAHCGNPLPDGSLFCPQCGASLGGSLPVDPSTGPRGLWEVLLHRLRQAVAPRYEVSRILGFGGMAGVYLATDTRLGRPVAIKVMSPSLMSDPNQMERFRQEARATAKLSHPNIVTIHEIEERQGLQYLVMAYIEGTTLSEILSENPGPFPLDRSARWIRQIAQALDHAHGLGIVHRDIKPGNILIDGSDNALVTDFGIAKMSDEPGLTRTGMMVGTPTYMSPEQCLSGEIGGASDQYALAVLSYHILTGNPPFTGGTMTVLHKHVSEAPEPLASRRPDCPAELASAIDRALAKDPADRWPSMEAFIGALRVGGAPSGAGEPAPGGTGATSVAASDRDAASHADVADHADAPAHAEADSHADADPPLPDASAYRGAARARPIWRRPEGIIGGAALVLAAGLAALMLLPGGPGSSGDEGSATPGAGTNPMNPAGVTDDLTPDAGDPGDPPDAAGAEGEGASAGGEDPDGVLGGDADSGAGVVAGDDSVQENPPRTDDVAGAPPEETDEPEPTSGRLVITGTLPPGARLEGARAGALPARLPLQGGELDPGMWTLSLEAPGYEPLEHRVQVSAGDTVQWAPALTQSAPDPVEESEEPEPPAPAFDPSDVRDRAGGAIDAFVEAFETRRMSEVLVHFPSAPSDWQDEFRTLIENTDNIRDLETEARAIEHLDTTEERADLQFVLAFSFTNFRNQVESSEINYRAVLRPDDDGVWRIRELVTLP